MICIKQGMITNSEATFYDVLDLGPDATPQEVRGAYLRAKAAYNRDSIALYSLINQDETSSLVEQIEQAYQILSHPERRREYDRLHGILNFNQEVVGGHSIPSAKVAEPF